MKTYLVASLAFLAIASAALSTPRLVVSTPSLVPESEIDLVLDSPAVEVSMIGKTVENTWLEIQPALPGKLLWKAQNIARFIPDEILEPGVNYTFSITKNLAHLDKSEVPAGKIATLASEPFRIMTANAINRWSSEFSPATGAWLVVFNDAVDPAAAAAFISFSSKSGQRVAAKLEQATGALAGHYAHAYKPWAERLPGTPRPEILPESPIPNILVATPISPLPVGEGWVVSALKDLPNHSAAARITADSTYQVGNIEPFRVREIRSNVAADESPKIILTLNQPAPETLPDDFLETSVAISPRPENLAAESHGRQIHLTGDFTDLTKYSVTLKGPFTSRAGLGLAAALTEEVVFEHVDPELILPSNTQAQLANGIRSYRIHTVNLASVHVRIKKLGGSDLVRAYQGYRHYTGVGHDGAPIQPTAPLPYSLVAGETIFEKEILLDNLVDTSREITLNWDEILPAELRHAALFIDVTGTPKPASHKEGRRNSQALVQLTDIGLAWKLTPTEAFIYAFSCDTGAPLPGVKIQLIGEDSATLQSSATDDSGLASVPRSATARHLRATRGGDGYLTAFDSTLDTVGLWHFPIRYSWNKSVESTRQAFLFTDRSLYRPGETVHLKGIVRTQRGNAIEPAESSPARLVVLDPTNKEIHTRPVTLSESGSFDFTWQLPASKTGPHTITLEFTDELALLETLGDDDNWEKRDAIARSARFRLPLRVEEFRRNAFEIEQTIAKPEPAATTLSADLTATYFQGQPVAAGNVSHFTRITSRNPYPERFRDFLFGSHRADDWGYWYHYFGYNSDGSGSNHETAQLHGETKLSADGKTTIAIEIPESDTPLTRQISISSEVTDANNQTLTSSASTTVHPASVYIGVSRNDRLLRAGEPVPLKIVATDTAGEPFPGAIQLTATLTREINSAVKSRTHTGATTTRNDVTEETELTTEITLDPAASAAQGTEFTFTPKSTGLHFLTLRGTDPAGRAFATTTRYHVYGTDQYPWLYEDGLRVKLVAEKKSYKPGETARVLVLSPIEGTALVTIEREKVLRSFLVPLKADNPVIEIPLTDADAPNAFVSVLIVKGAKESAREHKQPQLRLGYCELIVENLRDSLAITLAEPPPSYRPGDPVTLTGTITTADGAPAAGAEVTLYAEDEGTLAVMGYETPRPLNFFYKPRLLDVNSGTSFQTFISEDPETQYFHNKGFFIGGGGDAEQFADLLRKNFDPCATWTPALVTDSAGNFSHSFQLPDTLTRYRVIAVAHHGAARFGHSESSILVKKDLMLEPKTPRFAHQTDTFNTQVLVQNASTFTGTWEIKLDVPVTSGTPCLLPLGGLVETVTLAPGASTTVVYPVRAEHTGEAVLTWQATPVSIEGETLTVALQRNLSDSVEARFPVQYPMPLLRQSKLIRLDTPGARQDLRRELEQSLLDGTGDIELEFSRSPLVEAAGSIDFLLSYPHGCLEQTTSSLMPWFAVNSLSPVVPSFAKIPAEKSRAAIQAGTDRLLSMQLRDGSFTYWPGGTESVPWSTPYASLGLVMAAEKGAHVPASAIDALKKNLIESLRGIAQEKSPSLLENHVRALLVLAIAGEPQPAYHSVLIDRIAELTPSARALLATAICKADPTSLKNQDLAKSLLNSKVPFGSKPDGWMRWTPDQAYQLLAWTAADPTGVEATKTLDKLLNDRSPYGHWRTTWVNGWSLIAMAAYADSQDLGSRSIAFTLDSDDGSETISVTPDQPAAARSFALTPGLKLDLAADHPAFVRLKIAAKPRIAPLQPVATNGLSIDRIHERILPDGTAELLTQPKLGDLIRVTLRVTLPSDDTRYLVIEDPLPALFETVNTDFKSQRAAIGAAGSEKNWQVSHSELRSDRAVFYLDQVWRRGTYNLTYLARCTVSGQATAPPAKVESMYDPENYALSASRLFTAD